MEREIRGSLLAGTSFGCKRHREVQFGPQATDSNYSLVESWPNKQRGQDFDQTKSKG
jgi:hypothetical protein